MEVAVMAAYEKLTEMFKLISDNENTIHQLKLDLQLKPAATKVEADERAAKIKRLSVMLYDSLKNEDIADLFEEAASISSESLDQWQQKNLQLMWETYQREANIPSEIVGNAAEATASFTAAHPQLKANNDWQGWSGHLKEVVKPMQQKAAVLQEHLKSETPYDAMLSWYTGGTTAQELEDLFQPFEEAFPKLLQNALTKQKHEGALEPLPIISQEKQADLSRKILTMMGFDFNRGSLRIHESVFCETVNGHTFVQMRIEPENILTMIRATCHEGGHALYHQGLPKKWDGQPVAEVQSYLVSEMVAYFYEFHIATHPAFLSWVATEVGMDANLLMAHAKQVTPSTVSYECDELSLSVHPLIRFPFDKGLINGDIDIDSIPKKFNAKTALLLGTHSGEVYSRGVMAPVHWSKGLFGYFPIYLAALMAAAQLSKAVDVRNLMAQYSTEHGLYIIKNALEDTVFSQGSFLSTNDLIKKATGTELSSADLIEHFRNRY